MVTFVDQVTLHLRAGHGGNGCVSVRREKFKPLAGPDGGNGGHGGDIVLVADPQVTTLLAYHRPPHRASDNGQPGMGDHRSGAAARAPELPVPVGTVVKDADGNELVDLTEPGMRFVVAPGGQGGLGNAALATTKRKAPGFALLGTPGWRGRRRARAEDRRGCRARRLPVAPASRASSPRSPPRSRRSPTTRSPRCTRTSASCRRATTASPSPTFPASSRARARARGSASSSCATSSAAPRCCTSRLRDARARAATRSATSTSSSRELAAYPVPEGQVPLLERPQLIALNKIDVPEARELADFVRPELEAPRLPRLRDLRRSATRACASSPSRSASSSTRPRAAAGRARPRRAS